MALDRQSIEKKDFPIGRRGYDPAAVDAHLSALAEEIEELKRSQRRRTDSLAAATSDRVRSILEAAETSASEIQHQAEEDAREIRAEASGESKATREQATSQARDYVGRVSESASEMLGRVEAMESELSALFETLRTGGHRMNADLQLLEGNLEEVREAIAPQPRFEPEAEPSPAISPVAEGSSIEEETEDVPAPASAGDDASEPVFEPAAAVARTDSENGSVSETENGSDDPESARLIALNMALNGSPRDETDRYLAENFRLADRGGLLDEVYASVEG